MRPENSVLLGRQEVTASAQQTKSTRPDATLGWIHHISTAWVLLEFQSKRHMWPSNASRQSTGPDLKGEAVGQLHSDGNRPKAGRPLICFLLPHLGGLQPLPLPGSAAAVEPCHHAVQVILCELEESISRLLCSSVPASTCEQGCTLPSCIADRLV